VPTEQPFGDCREANQVSFSDVAVNGSPPVNAALLFDCVFHCVNSVHRFTLLKCEVGKALVFCGRWLNSQVSQYITARHCPNQKHEDNGKPVNRLLDEANVYDAHKTP